MHDLLHELARSVSNDECFSFIGDELEKDFPSTILHLYLQTNNINLLAKVNKLKNLRTLVFYFTGVSNSSGENANVFERVIKSLKNVRVLLLVAGRMHIKIVGDAIGNLTHLRFLSFDVFNDASSEMNNFLKSICKLYHLQVLKNTCRREIDFPEAINPLINLRHLKPIDRSHNVLGIEKLVNLQELNFFVRKESGYNITKLKNLNQLRELEIGGLENVLSCEEAKMVELHKKAHLKRLKLMWTADISELGKDEEILDSLHVPSWVKNLVIKGYGGCRSANWMEMETALREKEVEYVELNECSRWEQLPPFKMLQYLKCLKLEKMPVVKKIDFSEDGYAQLGVLKIAEMEQLEEWSLADSTSKVEINQWCPRLDDLEIKGCPKLQVLPSLPFSLRLLELENVGLNVLPTISPPAAPCRLCSPSLSSLRIYNCKRLTSLSKGLLQQNLVALKKVTIEDCEELVALPVQGFRHLCSLEELIIENCPKLQQEEEVASSGEDGYSYLLPSSLRYLYIRRCGDWVRSLPTLLQGGLTSLQLLKLVGCESLTSLPTKEVWRTLSSLKYLTIRRCPNIVAQSTVEEQEKVDFTSTIEVLWIDDPSLLLLIDPLRSLTSVRSLYFYECGKLESMDGELERWLLQNRNSLQTLELKDCESLTSLPSKEAWRTLTSLKMLRIRNCPNLILQVAADAQSTEDKDYFTSTIEQDLRIDDPLLLLIEPLRSLTSVSELHISDHCGKLESMDGELERWLLQNSSSLQTLYLLNAVSLKSLPCTLQTLSSLQQLVIDQATSLESVPQLPSSLKYMLIYGCNNTLKERLKKDEGADWTHIKHITNINIQN